MRFCEKKIYPTEAFEADYKTNTPLIFAGVVAGTFLLVIVVYYIYDLQVQQRNELMIENAAKSNAIVTNIIPDHLRDRLLNQQEKNLHRSGSALRKSNLKTFLNDGNGMGDCQSDAPLADLFLDCTVLFADITGFTVRHHKQIFSMPAALLIAHLVPSFLRRLYRRHGLQLGSLIKSSSCLRLSTLSLTKLPYAEESSKWRQVSG